MKQKTAERDTQTPSRLLKSAGTGSLIAAAIFLFNPVINIIDVLPDFFGYLLLLRGLSVYAEFCPDIADAVQGLNKLKWFMLLKLAMMPLVVLVDDTFVLVFTFGFALIEMIYAIPAIGRIFNGLEYAGLRFNGKAVYQNNRTVRALTYLFFYLKLLLPVLPELTSLSSYDYDGYVNSGVQFNFASFKGMLFILAMFLMTLSGIAWLITILPYFKRIGRDNAFVSQVIRQYRIAVVENVGLQTRRTVATLTTLLAVGFVFFLNLWFDGVNVIPGFIGAVFLLAAAFEFGKLRPSGSRTRILCLIYLGLSLASYFINLYFSVTYGIDIIDRNFDAYDFYSITRILYLLEYAAMIAAVLPLFGELRLFIRNLLGAAPEVKDKRLIAIYDKQRRELDRGVVIGLIAFIVTFALNLAYLLLRAELEELANGTWLIPFISTGIWWVYMKTILGRLNDQTEYKYL